MGESFGNGGTGHGSENVYLTKSIEQPRHQVIKLDQFEVSWPWHHADDIHPQPHLASPYALLYMKRSRLVE